MNRMIRSFNLSISYFSIFQYLAYYNINTDKFKKPDSTNNNSQSENRTMRLSDDSDDDTSEDMKIRILLSLIFGKVTVKSIPLFSNFLCNIISFLRKFGIG